MYSRHLRNVLASSRGRFHQVTNRVRHRVIFWLLTLRPAPEATDFQAREDKRGLKARARNIPTCQRRPRRAGREGRWVLSEKTTAPWPSATAERSDGRVSRRAQSVGDMPLGAADGHGGLSLREASKTWAQRLLSTLHPQVPTWPLAASSADSPSIVSPSTLFSCSLLSRLH